jgi:hypothetical protein
MSSHELMFSKIAAVIKIQISHPFVFKPELKTAVSSGVISIF